MDQEALGGRGWRNNELNYRTRSATYLLFIARFITLSVTARF
ncbi:MULTISPECIES: hypothetical protein [Paenibacillus]|nr:MULTISPECIES: hypothetical protein [Paenibacillus]